MSSWKKRNRHRRIQNTVIGIPFKITISIDTTFQFRPVHTLTTLDDFLREEGILEHCESVAKERLGLT